MPISPESVVPWKVRLFFVGAFFLLVGIIRNQQTFIIAAIVTLAIAFVLRFVGRKPRHEPVHPSWFEDDAPRDEERRQE